MIVVVVIKQERKDKNTKNKNSINNIQVFLRIIFNSHIVQNNIMQEEEIKNLLNLDKRIKYNSLNKLPDILLNNLGRVLSWIPNQKIKIISNRLKLNKISRVMWTHVYPFDGNLSKLLDNKFK